MVKHAPNVFEYSYITDGIFIGTNLCCQTHFDRGLLEKGITADVSLEDERLDAPFGVDYYLWLPTPNHFAPSQKQLDLGVEFLQDLVERKVKVYVHCERGHGRAPSLVAAYLVSKGLTVAQAVDFIKTRRGVVHPNKKQQAAIEKFRKRLKKR
ncbi:MAG: dual specificity protein phosphatase family protein [Candidatus Micrarchaeia archaeon]